MILLLLVGGALIALLLVAQFKGNMPAVLAVLQGHKAK